MSRSLRIQYSGAIYHVTVRGNARQAIYADDADRRLFYSRMESSVEHAGVRVYLFCLMTNHVHLVLETPKGNLSAFMQSLLTGYTVCYNLRHRRHGHLMQGRYGARLVSGDEYLLKLSRYVHLNPVKVGALSRAPIEDRLSHLRRYPWSSYRSYIGRSVRIPWVTYEPMLSLVDGKSPGVSYRRFVEAGLAVDDEEFTVAMNESVRCIGPEKFRDWVEEQHALLLTSRRCPEDVALRHLPDRWVESDEVLDAVAKLSGGDVDSILARRRGQVWKGIAACLMVKHTGMTRRDVARVLGLGGGSGVSYQIKLARQALANDSRLANRIQRLERKWQ
jgi:putative transposase